jgi:hypothetical protein
MTAVSRKPSQVSGWDFQSHPPPMVEVKAAFGNVPGTYKLSLAWVRDDPDRTRLSPTVFAALDRESHRAYIHPLNVKNGPADRTARLKLCLPTVSLASPPVVVIGKQDRKMIRNGDRVGLFLGKPTPSPLVKYMCVSEGEFLASFSPRWSIFEITLVSSSHRHDEPISYGSTIVLTDIATRTRSSEYVVFAAQDDDFCRKNGSVKELQRLGFRRNQNSFLAMSEESLRSGVVGDQGSLLLRDEVRPASTSKGRRTPGSFSTRASWTIVSINSFDCSFFDLLDRTTVTLFPILQNPTLDVFQRIIYAEISQFYYTDRTTGQRASLEVWVGVNGPLPVQTTKIDCNGAY